MQIFKNIVEIICKSIKILILPFRHLLIYRVNTWCSSLCPYLQNTHLNFTIHITIPKHQLDIYLHFSKKSDVSLNLIIPECAIQKDDNILWRPSLAKFEYTQELYSVFYLPLVTEQFYLLSTTAASGPLKVLCNRYPCIKGINIQRPTTNLVTCQKSPAEADQ